MATLGARLRRLRRERGCTLQEVSDGSGLTPSFLSRLERGIVNISVGNLRRVASYFGVPITYFFTEELVPRGVVVRQADRRVERWPHHAAWRASVLPPAAGHLCAEVVTLPSGQAGAALPIASWRTLFYVLQGQVTCELAEQRMQLSPGDVLYLRRPAELFWSSEGHAATLLQVSLQPEEH